MLKQLINKLPNQQHVSTAGILLSAGNALITIAVIAWISKQFLSASAIPYIIASMGASSVLVFAVPSSPMNHPWSLLGSHLFSAFIGITCLLYIPNVLVAAPLSVALSILAMHYLRCMHPPGGATAMLIILAGETFQTLGYQTLLTPVLLNTLILLLSALLIQNIMKSQRKPAPINLPNKWNPDAKAIALKPPFEAQDLQQAINELDTYIDIKKERLIELYTLANQHYQQRHLGELRCSDLMMTSPHLVEYATELSDVWHWLEKEQLTALPVVNRARHVVGVISIDDFIRHANKLPQESLEARLEALITHTPALSSDKPEVAGQIMTSPAITVSAGKYVAELLPLMDQHHIHHIPIVDDAQKLIGMVERGEILALLTQNNSHHAP